MTLRNIVNECDRCLYTANHPLGIVFDDENICSGCRIHEEKDSLDWNDRWKRLEELVSHYKLSSQSKYDCIVPVSGGMDSYFVVHNVKERLGLNPLLVSYNKQWNTPLGVRNLANLRKKFNCDLLLQTINPISIKKITRTTLRNFGSIYWHCIAGQTVFPVQVACDKKIPLIIWGGHQGTEQVGMFSHLHEVEMTRRYRKDHDLMGFEADDLLSAFDTLSEKDIWQLRYPDDTELNSVGVRGIYLSNFIRWDPKAQHEQMIEKYDYRTCSFNRTLDSYDFVDCYNYMALHDYTKQLKHGYTKVTDHMAREIRHGRISRNAAQNIVSKFENQPVNYLDKFCSWLGISQRSLEFVLDLHRNPVIWERTKDRAWVKRNVGKRRNKDFHYSEFEASFISNSTIDRMLPSEYILIGKGAD